MRVILSIRVRSSSKRTLLKLVCPMLGCANVSAVDGLAGILEGSQSSNQFEFRRLEAEDSEYMGAVEGACNPFHHID
jgi:hypothetical protein